MTKEEIFNDFVNKVKSGEYDLFNVCRSNSDGLHKYRFDVVINSSSRQLINKLLDENGEVAGKMMKLEKFMDTDAYLKLPRKERRLMIIQYNAMQTYADVLLQRIDELKEKK